MEVIYIHDLESIEVSILSQVILHTFTNTSHHKLYVKDQNFTYFMLYSPTIGTQMHQSRIQEVQRVEFLTQQVYLEKLVCVWTLLC